ncbi:MAG TPA: universal stress protein [Gemmataceae bacterium]|nr:universal stress protein [Gemmataceae bacterium]
MFRTVLAPLDGSLFAEQALPYALGIVRRGGAALDLVHVHVLYALEEPISARYSFDPEIDEEQRRQEQLYLDGTAKWLAAVSPGKMTTAVVNGLGANSILQRVHDRKADLVVMTTHGRGSLGRMFLGSVADEMVRRAAVPVLLVRPHGRAPRVVPEPLLEHVLVPLDGSALAERVLEPALKLVRLWEGRCTLLQVVEARHPSATSEQEQEARTYLEKIAGRLRDEGVPVRTRVVVAPHAASVILEEAQAQHCDFIALATHGRGGVGRILLGSVADKVIRGATTPVLVYRPVGD